MTAIYTGPRRAVFVPTKEGAGEWIVPYDACSSLCAPNHEPCSVTESGACLGKAYAKAVPMLIGAARILADADFGSSGWTAEAERAAAQMRAALRALT